MCNGGGNVNLNVAPNSGLAMAVFHVDRFDVLWWTVIENWVIDPNLIRLHAAPPHDPAVTNSVEDRWHAFLGLLVEGGGKSVKKCRQSGPAGKIGNQFGDVGRRAERPGKPVELVSGDQTFLAAEGNEFNRIIQISPSHAQAQQFQKLDPLIGD